MRLAASVPVVLLLSACGGSQVSEPSTAPDGPATFSTSQTDAPLPRNETDAPEISRSAGEEGGVVVLWPRVVPRDARDGLRGPASAIQQRLRALVQQAAPARVIDERPEPERVCPRSGCLAPAVGALLVRSGDGCAAFLLVSAPGTTPTGVVPWIGEATVRNSMVPFREPPEGQVAITDFVRCDSLETHLPDHEPELLERLRQELP